MKYLFAVTALAVALQCQASETVWLSSLDLTKMRQGWGKPQVDKSVLEKPLRIGKEKFERGVGTHAASSLWVELGGAEHFEAMVGVDDCGGDKAGSVEFKVMADGKTLWRSGVMKSGELPKPVHLELHGQKTLLLLVTDSGDNTRFDYADWAEARFTYTGTAPKAIDAPREEAVILTPKPGPWARINGPKVYGCRPGNPFLYRIPATGHRPIKFSAKGLPKGLELNAESGIITGVIAKAGVYQVTLMAKNLEGKSERPFKIVCGDTLALTPPMGWNHWYAHYNRITDAMMRRAADEMIRTGMADVGYQYVSIDDCWMNAEKHKDPMRVGPLRDANGNFIPNRHFPDMKALTDYIHSKGLKAGTYSSPGPLTCAGFAGSYRHEAQDAKQIAEWGFDFLKYDWCSYNKIAAGDTSVTTLKKPYILMGDLLKQQKRDIVFNLCQYGRGNVWEWGAEVGGHSWRTAGDLGFALDRLFVVALKNAEHAAWSKPGSWNDPDYIQIGMVGRASGHGLPEPCRSTPSEQYAFMSLWCLMASPLFYSGDMEHLDEFTLNVLCNPEVIDVDQDPLGKCARVIQQEGDGFVMVKELEDGSKAVGLCNGGEWPTTVAGKWSDLGLKGKQVVRDLWRQKDLGVFEGEYSASVPRHGVVLLRIRSEKN